MMILRMMVIIITLSEVVDLIYIKVLSKYWNPMGKVATKENMSNEDLVKFHKWLAKEYLRLVVKSIDDQRFASKWQPLSASHLKYKITNGYSASMWEMTGELKESMEVKKLRDEVVEVGFKKGKHGDSNLTYEELAIILEFGTIRIPPRPLFRLVKKYISSNIRYFYSRYLILEKGV